MSYFVIVLPKDKEGKTNRQMYEFTDFESAKQSFHSNCGKYFKSESLVSASACIVDEFSNELLKDSWMSTEVTE